MWKYIILLVVLNEFLRFYQSVQTDDKSKINSIPEDAILNATQLIKKYGYPMETHELQTEDGYLITMHRIPGGRVPNENAHKIPVLLIHGIICSSVDWIISGPEKALAYILADEGYDVWMGNVRGNYLSRKHVSLDPDKDDQYWKFSWSEIGIYDIPKMVNHVLETTGREKLHYIGHSQGAVVFFVMASEMPEFNNKILLMQGLAPGSYTQHSTIPIGQFLIKYVNTLEKLSDLIGYNEFLPNTKFKRYFTQNYCHDESVFQPICEYFVYILLDYKQQEINSTMLPVYMSHFPAGTALRQLLHFFQEHLSHKFRKYDFGKEKNLEMYGTPEPPDYNLTKITAPTVLHYSYSDVIVNHLDVERLYSELGNPKGLFRVPADKFNHLDFLWRSDARSLVYDLVLSQMKMYNPH